MEKWHFIFIIITVTIIIITIRNDIDVIGVRAGCTFTGYSDSSFNGQRMTIRAEGYDRLILMMIPVMMMIQRADQQCVRQILKLC